MSNRQLVAINHGPEERGRGIMEVGETFGNSTNVGPRGLAPRTLGPKWL